MTFLNPTYFWALLGIIIPIAIHFWSNKESKIIQVGSISFFKEADSQKSSKINLNELLLLFLRLLIISLLVFIMAQPQIKSDLNNRSITYIVEPSLLGSNKFQAVLDTINPDHIKLLQSGFPDYDKKTSRNTEPVPPYWQLAQEMEDLFTDSIVVFSQTLLTGIKGVRPTIKSPVNWIVVNKDESLKKPIYATHTNDSIHLLNVISNPGSMFFEKQSLPYNLNGLTAGRDSLFLKNQDPSFISLQNEEGVPVVIYYTENYNKEMIFIKSSLRALSSFLKKPIDVTILKDTSAIDVEKFDKIIWLSDKQIPKVKQDILAFKLDSLSHSLINKGLSQNRYYLTNYLNTENVIKEYLPEQLLLFLNFNKGLTSKIDAYDKRVMNEQDFKPKFAFAKAKKSQTTLFDISRWLWLCLAMLLVLERVIAQYRGQ